MDKLLRDMPDIVGNALGSPGMETLQMAAENYDVLTVDFERKVSSIS